MNKKLKKIIWIPFTILSALLICLTTVTTFAYFSTKTKVITEDGSTKYAKLGMNISLLFDKLTVANGTDLGIYKQTTTSGEQEVVENYTFDNTKEWGTAQNPYIISEIRHLQNLSALQEIGYFDELFDISSQKDDASITNLTANVPYFLVCKPDGTPATIDGSDITFTPIGNDEYPFYGFVGGSFTTGTTTVCSKTSNTSAIYGVTVKTTTDIPDVGLFGSVGYLGVEPESEYIEDGEGNLVRATFSCFSSTIENILLADVKIQVNEPTLKDKFVSAANHFLSYSNITETGSTTPPHENHHVGILAGHVSYTNVNNISVYYSSTDIPAIDVKQTTKDSDNVSANYLSSAGIIGFMYNMNPAFDGSTAAAGSGVTSGDISTSGSSGTGGGLLSGSGRGYLTATEIYDQYSYVSANRSQGELLWKYQETDESSYATAIMITKYSNGTYKTESGKTATVSGGVVSADGKSWSNYIVRYNAGTDANPSFTHHWAKNESTELYSYKHYDFIIFSGKDNDDPVNDLCVEYVRDRILWGTENSGHYYFYDGVFTFCLSSQNDYIEDTWVNDEVDSFTIGADDSTKWDANIAKGNKAVVAYTKQITNSAQLEEAVYAGKRVIIMYKTDSQTGYLMTLSQANNGGSGNSSLTDNAYTTPGTSIPFADTATKESLYNGFVNGDITESPLDDKVTDEDSIVNLIANWNDYEILNLGTSSFEDPLSILRTKYTVNATPEIKYYYENGREADIQEDGAHVYSGQGEHTVNGYYYYRFAHTPGVTWDNYIYSYYVTSSGTTSMASNQRTSITSYISNQWQYKRYGLDFYNKDNKGTAPLLFQDWESEKYYLTTRDLNGNITYTSAQVSPSGGSFKVTYNESNIKSYFYKYVNAQGVTEYYYMDGTKLNSAPSYSKTENIGDDTYNYTYNIYTDGTHTGLLLTKVASSFAFSDSENKGNYLRLLYREYLAASYYSIWCGTDSYASNPSNFSVISTPNVANVRYGNVAFNSDGSCYISYTYNGNTRYIHYNTSNFNGSSSQNDACKLYIYSVEGTQGITYGRITFDPDNTQVNGTDCHTFDADEYVLWPNQTYSGSSTGDTTYAVKSLNELRTADSGWKNNAGNGLTAKDLQSKFVMTESLQFGIQLNILNGSIGNAGYIIAPVGSLGTEANIPLGSVAFRMNSSGEQKIRVIVAIPQTDLYKNEPGSGWDETLDGSHWFGVWQVEAAGESWLQTYSQNSALEKFLLPVSNQYAPGTDAGGTNSNYITVTYGGNTYRCYLNGNMVLVAYTFTINGDAGDVYILGTTGSPMELVYLSADSTASEGRDGSTGSKLGTIDFVYDYNGSIITVDKVTSGAEDYNYYYSTLSLAYTDNSKISSGTTYVNINDFILYISRTVVPSGDKKTWLNVAVKSTNSSNAALIKVVDYTATESGDYINRSADSSR